MISEGSDERKTRKTEFPRPRMSGKQEKQCFRGLGWAENEKNTFPPRRKCRNQQNLRFRHGGKTENGKKYVSATAEIQKNGKINVSATAEAFFPINFYFLSWWLTQMRSIDRGVVLLSKNMSFPTANDRLGVNLGTIFASNKHKNMWALWNEYFHLWP